jgi:hypothetical protein
MDLKWSLARALKSVSESGQVFNRIVISFCHRAVFVHQVQSLWTAAVPATDNSMPFETGHVNRSEGEYTTKLHTIRNVHPN